MSNACLIIGDRGIGDMVLVHSLIQTLKAQEPGNPIDLVATEHNKDVAYLLPEVREVLVRPSKAASKHPMIRLETLPQHIRVFSNLFRKIKAQGYSKAYILRANKKDMLVPYLARIPQRIGHLSNRYSKVLLTDTYADTEPQHQSRSLAMLGHPPYASFDVPMPALSIPENAVSMLPRNLQEMAETQALVAICPGGSLIDKKWPASSYGKLGDWLMQKRFQVIILGGSEDQAMAKQIINHLSSGKIYDLTGRLSLMENLTLLSRCRALISNDTGLMQAGAALGITVLGILICSDPVKWRPIGPKANYISAIADKGTTSENPPSVGQAITKLESLL